MNNENNPSNDELDKNPSQRINSPSDEISDSEFHTPEENKEADLPAGIPGTPLPEKDPKNKNPYKIAFYTLGGILILGAASFFGYKYMKDLEVPVAENSCLDTDTRIYDAYKDAVVLIRHQYGYFAEINGVEFQLTVPEAAEETIYGTGFFIDEKANMLTNSHVLRPWNSTEEHRDKMHTNIRNMKLKIASVLTTDIPAEGYETFILSNWNSASVREEYDEGYGETDGENQGEEFVSSEESSVDSTGQSDDLAASIPEKEYVSADDIEVYVKTVSISVALHNSNDDWLTAEIVKISENSEIDLGMLQLPDHKTPETVVNKISLQNSIAEDKTLNPGQKAIMIGFPLGVDLAQTSSGIKVQLYNGQISKESDGNKIQYSITSTHGASGAPVFNDCGQLIAVNFSGVDQVQGFNFGIVAKHITEFTGSDTADTVP